MPSKRKRDSFDALTLRIFLLLFGLSSVAVGVFLLNWSGETANTAKLFGWACSVGGILAAILGLALSDEKAIKFSEKTGHHEHLIVYALASLALAWLIRRVRNET